MKCIVCGGEVVKSRDIPVRLLWPFVSILYPCKDCGRLHHKDGTGAFWAIFTNIPAYLKNGGIVFKEPNPLTP
jgi:hypothetical protein